jgi:hypothetical protein
MHLDGISVVADRHGGSGRGWGRPARLTYSAEVTAAAAAAPAGKPSTGSCSASGYDGQCGSTKSNRNREETFHNIRHVFSVRVAPSLPLPVSAVPPRRPA